MKTTIKLFFLAVIFNLSSCKQNTTFSDYQYADKPQVIKCSNDVDSKLLNEALYAFENDIANHFDKNRQNVNSAYPPYIRQVASNRAIPYTTFVSEHTVAVANALKGTSLYKNGKLNYQSKTITCLAENMQEGGLKTTFNALLATNSMSKQLYGPALQTEAIKVSKDKNLAMYVALEYFYAQLNNIDFTNVDFNKKAETKPIPQKKPEITPIKSQNNKVDFNKKPIKRE